MQRNIVAFGGDPKCVTIAGQPSGSISVSILMASPLAKGLFQRAIGDSGGLFEPLQLAPKFLLANAERDGEKYAVSLGAASLKELRRLPTTLLTGNAGGIVHAVIEPYVLPLSPFFSIQHAGLVFTRQTWAKYGKIRNPCATRLHRKERPPGRRDDGGKW